MHRRGAVVTGLADRLAQLTPAQRALLDRRVRDMSATPSAPGRIPQRPDPARSRLTVDQERIWLIHQLDPTDPAYNVFFGWRVRGALDLDLLERAVNAVVQRHEALRTTFVAGDDLIPVQVVHDALPVTLDRHDLRDVPAAQREAAMQRLARAEVRRLFDLTTGPLVRVAAVRMDEQDHVMIGTVDHLVWDRASVGIFDRETAEFYTAFATGREPRLPDLEIQYADYAEWQPEWLRDEVHPRNVPYWRRRLEGASLVLELPADLPRPPVQTFNGARHEFRLTRELTEAIREFARRDGVTIYVALLAAWQLLLHRYTGQQDIVVGTTSSTRSRPETEPLIGYFLTMLPLRTTVRPDMSFRELVREARSTVVGAFDHKDMPFGTLLDELDIDRDPSRNPVYQTSFMFVDFHEQAVSMAGLAHEALVFDNRTAKDECMLCMFDDEVLADHLFGLLEYNTDLFAEATIARMAQHFERLLARAVAEPGRAVGELSLVGADEAETMLVAWNRTAAEREPGVCVEDLVRRRAAERPDAVAVVCGEQRLSYAELVARADRLAAYLRRRGAAPETVVGVCLERSCDMVVALLGVLISGAAYLPMDPQHPSQRLAAMTADASATLLVTESALADRLAECGGQPVLVDAEREAIASAPALGERPRSGDERLAYVIYTSGSTGRPKGVEVTQRNLVNLLLAMADEVSLEPDDVLAAVTSISFDIAGLELYGPLITGGQVVVVARDEGQDARRLAALLTERGVTVMQATPATWHLLTEAGWRNDGRMRVITGGEALPASLAQALVAQPGRTWNVYGPTETTIWSTARRLDSATEKISIGRPLSNTEVYVLDERLQPVPVGMMGELVIGGDGVARGYRGRPDVTAERFIPDHLGRRPGARLYRTGDQVRLRSDGNLVFVGRDDGQVKLRGYRIELGEIESRLETHPDLGRAVVLLREDNPGDRRLVAYVQGRAGPLQPERLRQHLRSFLPDYMVPAAFVELETFPLSTSGKIDRRALPAPASDRQADDYVAPRDPVELEVARIWERVLGTRPVGLHDRFFDLGGHSLLVLRLMAEIERHFGQQLPMAAIFQGATVERFAQMLRQGYEPETGPHLVQLRHGTAEQPVFFAHPAGSEVVCYVPFGRLLEPDDRPLYAIGCPRLVDGAFPYAGMQDRAAAYADVIRRAQPDGPYTLVGWCYGGINAFAIAHELERQGEQTSLLLIDAYPPQEVPIGGDPDRAAIVEGFALNLRWDYNHGDQRSAEELRGLTEEEHLDYLLSLARESDYLPPDAGREQMQAAFDLWTANLRFMWRYRPTPLAGKLTLIKARTDNPAVEGGAELFERWRDLAGEGLDVHMVDGNHYTIMREPLIDGVAAVINEHLAGVGSGRR